MRPTIDDVIERPSWIEQALNTIVQQRTTKEWCSGMEAAEQRSKDELTVQERCHVKRVRASKRPCGGGTSQEWMISHEELQRIKNKGRDELKAET